MANKIVTVEKIAQEDLSFHQTDGGSLETFSRTTWDGDSETVSKVTGDVFVWTGTYARTIRPGNIITRGPWIDSRSYSDLATAVSAIGSTEKTILITQTETITANLTIPANITLAFLHNGQITTSGAAILTINGKIHAGLSQIFSLWGGGYSASVVFGRAIREVYPEWFGAIGDGTTDDAAAINNAIQSLSTGGVVLFSANTYRIAQSLTMKNNVSLQGVNYNASIIYTNVDVDPMIVIQGSAGAGNARTSVMLKDIQVQSNSSATNSLVLLEYAQKPVFDNVYFNHALIVTGQVGIELDQGVSDVSVRNCYLTSANGIYKDSTEGNNGDYITIVNNTFETGGIYIRPLTTAMKNIRIADNNFKSITAGNNYAITISGASISIFNVVIKGNLISTVDRGGMFLITLTDLIVTDNLLSGYSNESSGTYNGIEISNCKNVVTSNNICDGNSTGNLAISIAGDDLNTVMIGNCSTNNSHASLEYSIHANSEDIAYYHNVPQENRIVTISTLSGSAIDVSKGADIYSITTTGAISTINNGYEGQMITLIFNQSSGTVTVVESSTIKLAGTGNALASVDDVMVLRKKGSAWYEVSRSAN